MYVPTTTTRDVTATPARSARRVRPGASALPNPPAAPDARPFPPADALSPPGTIVHDVHASPQDFSEFYRAAWQNVARGLAVALGDRDLAIDATDEAMARAYPRWDKLRGYDNPAAWVYRVGLNWARSYHRRLARRLPFARPETGEAVVLGLDPAVRRALLDLPLRLRTVVVCRLLLDWSVADTAAALGVRPGTVRSRLHRALQSLQPSLQHLR